MHPCVYQPELVLHSLFFLLKMSFQHCAAQRFAGRRGLAFRRLFASRSSAAQSISNVWTSRFGSSLAASISLANQALGDLPGSCSKSATTSALISDNFFLPIIKNSLTVAATVR